MAFDGLIIADLVKELREKTIGGRITRIVQPEHDELILTIKTQDTLRLLMSADASLPLIYLTDLRKEAPSESPAFCMLLRKYIMGGKIKDILQPENERVIFMDIEHYDELGDLRVRRLIIEIMGKHSNIILCDDQGMIIDSIKRIPATVSSVREVLTGRPYFIAKTSEKLDPTVCDREKFISAVKSKNQAISKALYMSFNGISPLMANEFVFRAGLDEDIPAEDQPVGRLEALADVFVGCMEDLKNEKFDTCEVFKDGLPFEYAAFELTSLECLKGITLRKVESPSELLETFYMEKNLAERIRQRSATLRHSVSTIKERIVKKYELQLSQLRDTEKREKYKLYGELLCAYAHEIKVPGKSVTVYDYNTGEDISIPMDEELSTIDNSKMYFEKYRKMKRTFDALTGYIEKTKEDLDHIGSVALELDLATCEEDLIAIRRELEEAGYVKVAHTSGKGKKRPKKEESVPLHYVTSDGFHIYVGKNNYQNDELTFKFASGNDWWFHLKGAPGSHVILKTDGREASDRAMEQAAAVAAYYSSGRENVKAEVDYLERRNVKKPGGARPGFVVYYTNYSMVVKPSLDDVKRAEE
ncbi:MAG: NFACT family protein [Lachnospiraceae bacterium]|nr:NFACT family protein [Lachnospiraceae bacterium]